MNRSTGSFTINHPQDFKQQALAWANQYVYAAYLDNNAYTHCPDSQFECLIGADALQVLNCNAGSAFGQLEALHAETNDWLFGFMAYDLKNEVERLDSKLPDGTGFPDLCFFQPKHVVKLTANGMVTIEASGVAPSEIFNQINATSLSKETHSRVHMQPRISKQEYLDTVDKLRQHIAEGDVYEINYCQEFYAEGAEIEPVVIFTKLNKISQAPFSCYLKLDDKYLLCASPERFLRKQGNKLTSMPIKGTIRRGAGEEDEALKAELRTSVKERAENVMIVDLVRNDLTRSCIPGTIKVEELFGIYSFPKVHHLVSTISGKLRPEATGIGAIKDAFPMGSMTGAPKVRVMQLTERYERSRRGIYSGAAGYFAPNGDFDLNVVIRSLVYNQTRQYLSYHVGGAITWDSVPEKEYAECLLKAAGIMEVLGGDLHGPSANND